MNSAFGVLIGFIITKILIFGFSSSAGANQIDIETVTKKWVFLCDAKSYGFENKSNDNLAVRLREYTVLSFNEGWKKLNSINPELAKHTLSALDRKIEINCNTEPGGMGHANTRNNSLGITSAALSNFISLDKIGAKLPDPMVFHELLHLAKIDNTSKKSHNSVGAYNPADVVYACSGAVFSDGMVGALDDCVVCRLARKKEGQSELIRDQGAFREAEIFCRKYYASKPAAKDKLSISEEVLDPSYYKKIGVSENRSRARIEIDWGRFLDMFSAKNDEKTRKDSQLREVEKARERLKASFQEQKITKEQYDIMSGMLDNAGQSVSEKIQKKLPVQSTLKAD